MSQITTYCYDASGDHVYRKGTTGHGWLNASDTAKSGWEMEGATHVGECDVTQTLTIWLNVKNGVIANVAYSVDHIVASANSMCNDIRGMTVEDVKKMLDTQPAGQSAGLSAVAAALAAALASGNHL